MDFDVQELVDVLGKATFPAGYRLYDFAGGQKPTLAQRVESGAFATTRYVGIQRESDGSVRFLQIK